MQGALNFDPHTGIRNDEAQGFVVDWSEEEDCRQGGMVISVS
jgi:hypothetical protein